MDGHYLSVEELEALARQYAELKQSRDEVEQARLAVRIIDSISRSFALPVKEEAPASEGTISYTYRDNAAFPALFDFLAEILHTKVPIEVGRAKFGPGEVLVSSESKEAADMELELAEIELQKLVHGRRAEIFAKFTGAAP